MNYRKKLKDVKALVFDIDGVFSREFVVLNNGEFHRLMNPKDGYAIKKAVQEGFTVGIITGATTSTITERFEVLGVSNIYLAQTNKIEAMNDFCEKNELSLGQILYMGDDIPDYETLKAVSFSACPADAASEILEICDYISDKQSGQGCVRDVVEQVLKIQNKWL